MADGSDGMSTIRRRMPTFRPQRRLCSVARWPPNRPRSGFVPMSSAPSARRCVTSAHCSPSSRTARSRSSYSPSATGCALSLSRWSAGARLSRSSLELTRSRARGLARMTKPLSLRTGLEASRVAVPAERRWAPLRYRQSYVYGGERFKPIRVPNPARVHEADRGCSDSGAESASDFVRVAAERRADEVLLERDLVTVVPADFFDQLLSVLDQDAQSSPALAPGAAAARGIVRR